MAVNDYSFTLHGEGGPLEISISKLFPTDLMILKGGSKDEDVLVLSKSDTYQLIHILDNFVEHLEDE